MTMTQPELPQVGPGYIFEGNFPDRWGTAPTQSPDLTGNLAGDNLDYSY